MVVDRIGSLPLLDHPVHTGCDYLATIEAECYALCSAIMCFEFLHHLGRWEVNGHFWPDILWHLSHLSHLGLETWAGFRVEHS